MLESLDTIEGWEAVRGVATVAYGAVFRSATTLVEQTLDAKPKPKGS